MKSPSLGSATKPKLNTAFKVSGDDSHLRYEPPDRGEQPLVRLSPALLRRLAKVPDLASTTSDVLDDLGWNLAVASDRLRPRLASAHGVAGHVLTIRYLCERLTPGATRSGRGAIKMAHNLIFGIARAGDILVIDASGVDDASTMGANAAAAAQRSGLQAAVVDGCIRDLAAIRNLGFPIWSKGVTPRTGKFRIEASSINKPVACGGVQVRPGDVAVADQTGICFIPLEVADVVIKRVLEVSPSPASGARRRY
jgi:4-hydroxy-4-methyl-2-oxoglutarate aldolase